MTIIVVKGRSMNLKDLEFYSLAEAKAKFSKVMDETKKKNIVITKNGLPQAIIVEYDKFVSLMEFVDQIKDLYLVEAGDLSRVKEIEKFFLDFNEE